MLWACWGPINVLSEVWRMKLQSKHVRDWWWCLVWLIHGVKLRKEPPVSSSWEPSAAWAREELLGDDLYFSIGTCLPLFTFLWHITASFQTHYLPSKRTVPKSREQEMSQGVRPGFPAVTAGDAINGGHFKETTCELIFSISKLPVGICSLQNDCGIHHQMRHTQVFSVCFCPVHWRWQQSTPGSHGSPPFKCASYFVSESARKLEYWWLFKVLAVLVMCWSKYRLALMS